ncbi:MAG TPA: class I SAM-dependent methyltransferase, partial [Chloroflexota bacterium]
MTERDVSFARRTLDLKAGMRVLETGCGWGRCTVELARLGCRVTAVDLSPPMVARARQSLEEAGLVADVRLATVRRLPSFWEPFDAIVGFRDDSPISAGDESDNLRMLQSLAGALRPGGRL